METTLNIRNSVLTQISAAALIQGISRSDMIIRLIKMIMNDISDPARLGTMVKYQRRRARRDWHIFHLRLQEDDYEYFLDLRKLLKMSVSLILAYAVKKFLKHPNKKINTDNYTYKNYMVIRELVGDIICWKFLWGCPPNLGKFIPYLS